jgi:ribosome biogenesis ATPase
VRYADLGGMSGVLSILRDVVQVPLSLPAAYAHLGVEPPRGVLLHGPPGCGKTLIAHALGGELGVYFRAVAGPELVGALSGESEARLRAVFDDASAHAPSILFIDEIDAIAPRRDDAQRGMERRIVSQLLACIDGLSLKRSGGAHVMLVAASSRPDALDPALRRTGRFDREVAIPIPDEAARADILAVLTRGMRLAEGEAKSDFLAIARATPGFVGADIAALAKEAAAGAIDRALRDGTLSLTQTDAPLPSGAIDTLCVTAEDFTGAAKRVQPSALREGFATVPNVSWDDVGALAAVRAELHMAILAPLRQPEAFAALGLAVPAGVLLFGPPGCGKTLLAKALASESRANFIAVKGPELLDKFVGESERAVRALFARARASAPCIIFFDELDALAPRRGGGGGGGGESNGVTERVVNQLLTEMDGLETRRDVFVIAATNRPDIIDPAMLRPGRLDKLLYVPLPTGAERAAILRTQARRTPLAVDVDFDAIAQHAAAARFSGADLASLVREAAVGVLRVYLGIAGGAAPEAKGAPPPLSHADFIAAFQKVQPSVSPADERMYNELRRKLRGGGGGGAE